jgi:7,8-dihydropterin-6-yl-methyl-4-(beta-D-ribofuranosyl)aminobenzene 5'-phosphate synthase
MIEKKPGRERIWRPKRLKGVHNRISSKRRDASRALSRTVKIMKVEILNLYSNEKAPGSPLRNDHGQSFLISIGDERVLFDLGRRSAILLHNMTALRVDPNAITAIVLSHGHIDHTGGLPGFIDSRTVGSPLPLFAHPSVREDKAVRIAFLTKRLGFPRLSRAQERRLIVQLSATPMRVAASLETTGEITERPEKDGIEPNALHREDGEWRADPVRDDISLVLHTREGEVIVAGCAHSGILNICRYVARSTKGRIRAVIGGTHMVRYSPEEVVNVASRLRHAYGYPDLYLNHCTDQLPIPFARKTRAIDILEETYGTDKVRRCLVGTTVGFTV